MEVNLDIISILLDMSRGVREKIPKRKVSHMALPAVSAHKGGLVYRWLISPLGSQVAQVR